MKIAILGWGSLIWQPKDLDFDKELGWNKEGPNLPVEFSRVSRDKRLTLVIDPVAKEIKTLYSISTHLILKKAISNLVEREGCKVNGVGYYEKSNGTFSPDHFGWKEQIKEWIYQTDIDAVIWTNLPKNFEDKNGRPHNTQNIVHYLESLSGDEKDSAEKYIRNTPSQIQTVVRAEIEKRLGWTAIEIKD
ncbi:hypothetical protein [Sphingobacterium siyangense]|uniref:hypothetical protein n=1 Tax=Sphingobacterium siyangense TaxID=459529 RepID=UPI003DA1ECCD